MDCSGPNTGVFLNEASRIFWLVLTWFQSNLAIVLALSLGASQIFQFQAWVEDYCCATVYASQYNEASDMFHAWFERRGLYKSARSRIAHVGWKGDGSVATERPLSTRIWNGSLSFWFRGSLLKLTSTVKHDDFEREVVLSIAGFKSSVIDEFLQECHLEFLQDVRNKTTVFENQDGLWQHVDRQQIRPLDTVIFDVDVKSKLVEDIKRFSAPETREWYASKSLPYRRGYLLHGPPGTGKTSLGRCMAGLLTCDLYSMQISQTDDQTLGNLFRALPEQCVVLLEDIDAVVTRPRSGAGEDGQRTTGPTLPGLLNAIDGAASREGRILVMTTNHRENIDNALLRPGRVDMEIPFNYISHAVATKLFEYIYKGDIEDEDLHKSATDFANEVSSHQMTSAKVLNYLIPHRCVPSAALAGVKLWLQGEGS